MAPEKEMVIKKEKQSRVRVHKGSKTMKLYRYLSLAQIRATAGFVVFHLYSTDFYVLISVAWSQSRIANKRDLKLLKFQLKTIWNHSNVHQQSFDISVKKKKKRKLFCEPSYEGSYYVNLGVRKGDKDKYMYYLSLHKETIRNDD